MAAGMLKSWENIVRLVLSAEQTGGGTLLPAFANRSEDLAVRMTPVKHTAKLLQVRWSKGPLWHRQTARNLGQFAGGRGTGISGRRYFPDTSSIWPRVSQRR